MSKKDKKADGKAKALKGKSKGNEEQPGISLTDVKEATNASKNVAMNFPPEPPVSETPKPEATVAPAETPTAESTPPDAPAPENLKEEPKVTEATATAAPETTTPPASAPSLEEQLLEKWLNGRTSINHFELANSGVVNLNHFAMLEGKVGKFRFRRTYLGDNWQITVEV